MNQEKLTLTQRDYDFMVKRFFIELIKKNRVEGADLLVLFLIERDLYTKYINNVSNYVGLTFVDIDDLRLLFKKTQPKDMLLFSFAWGDTPEGYNFWQKVNDEWLEYLEENVRELYEFIN